ncbi:MAG: S-layer homology domain-containing protein [Patescibacteria group bacterium]|nr:S-layer homology domain-containing protein [Patescibacteria group bacterium]
MFSAAEAARLGIVHGKQDGMYHAYDTLTRGEMAKIVINAKKVYDEMNQEYENHWKIHTFNPERDISFDDQCYGFESPTFE